MRRPVYFQYEMGSADNVSKTVDCLLSDWAQIAHLYSLVDELAEYFRTGDDPTRSTGNHIKVELLSSIQFLTVTNLRQQ